MAGPLPFHLLPLTSEVVAGRLMVGGCDLVEMAERYGTPLFVYDELHLRRRCREALEAFGGGVSYAAKAFLCVAMARLVESEGLGMDVATGGELAMALRAGFPPSRLVFHGNNKSSEELRMAIEGGVGRVVVDSFDEMDRIDHLHSLRGGAPVDVLIRITPGVDAHTHEFVATGHDDTKFGFTVSSGAAARAVRRAKNSPSIRARGVHAHIGSQVFRLESFREAARIVARMAEPFGLEELSLGGGLGVPYVEGESAPTIGEWAEALVGVCRSEGVRGPIMAEPGRVIAAAAAITLYRVGTIKEVEGVRTYLAVDGGMSDNPRPVLYGSGYEVFLPRAVGAPREREVTVVGKHCESGDRLVSEGWLPGDVEVGDIVATPVTGAYGHSMGSNYQKVPRPPVVFVSDGQSRLVVRREEFEDMFRLEMD